MTHEVRSGQFGSYEVEDAELSRGGVGSIHRTTDPRYVFKKYFDPSKAPDVKDLERLVEIGRRVLVIDGKKPGDVPESSVNWPVDLQLDRAGQVAGVILPLIPPTFFNDFGVRTLDFLIMRRAEPPAAAERVALLLRMAEILTFVDHRGLLHGDINAKNLAWTTSPHPVMYLIDCDGILPQQPSPSKGVSAAGWTDPRVLERLVPAHDRASDHYAVALAMYRGLLLTPGNLEKNASGRWKAPQNIPAGVDRRIADLILAGVDPLDPEVRPAPEHWRDALSQVYLPGGRWDAAQLATLPEGGAPAARPSPDPVQQFSKLPPIAPTTTRPAPPLVRPSPPPPARPAPPPPPRSAPTPPRHDPPPTVRVITNISQLDDPWPSTAPQRFVPGYLGRKSLGAGPAWYLTGIATIFLLPLVCLVYTAVALFQLRSLSRDVPHLLRARIALWIFLGISTLQCLSTLVGFLM